jgi:hypothetical protein
MCIQIGGRSVLENCVASVNDRMVIVYLLENGAIPPLPNQQRIGEGDIISLLLQRGHWSESSTLTAATSLINAGAILTIHTVIDSLLMLHNTTRWCTSNTVTRGSMTTENVEWGNNTISNIGAWFKLFIESSAIDVDIPVLPYLMSPFYCRSFVASSPTLLVVSSSSLLVSSSTTAEANVSSCRCRYPIGTWLKIKPVWTWESPKVLPGSIGIWLPTFVHLDETVTNQQAAMVIDISSSSSSIDDYINNNNSSTSINDDGGSTVGSSDNEYERYRIHIRWSHHGIYRRYYDEWIWDNDDRIKGITSPPDTNDIRVGETLRQYIERTSSKSRWLLPFINSLVSNTEMQVKHRLQLLMDITKAPLVIANMIEHYCRSR